MPDLDTTLQADYGVYRSPGLAAVWPELGVKLRAIFADRVATLPWVPADWSDHVAQVIAGGDAVRLLPLRGDGTAPVPFPSWLTASSARLGAWNDIAAITNQAVAAYAATKADEGRAVLDAAYADAAFWDRLYRIDVAIASAPGEAVDAVAGGVGRVLALNWHLVALVGVAALIYFNRGTILRYASRTVARG